MDIIAYQGNITSQLIEMEEGALITERIPATLMERAIAKGHNMYIDNFYSLVTFANFLAESGINITGTVRENIKQFPF